LLQDRKAEQDVLELDRAFNRAVGANDAAFMDSVLSDDCILTNTKGRVFGKSTRMTMTQSGSLVFDSYTADDLRISIYGDCAVVTERNTSVAGSGKDRVHTGQFRYTRVYVKRQGRWQVVAAQKTRIVED
jgi:ketosteroid isomerase-like protein